MLILKILNTNKNNKVQNLHTENYKTLLKLKQPKWNDIKWNIQVRG